MLISQKQSPEILAKILSQTQADVLIAAAGTIPLNALLKNYASLRQVVWVVERASRHMDWNEVSEGVGGKTEIIVWHDVVDEKNEAVPSDVPEDISDAVQPNIITVVRSSTKTEPYEIIEFTQKVELCHLDDNPWLIRI